MRRNALFFRRLVLCAKLHRIGHVALRAGRVRDIRVCLKGRAVVHEVVGIDKRARGLVPALHDPVRELLCIVVRRRTRHAEYVGICRVRIRVGIARRAAGERAIAGLIDDRDARRAVRLGGPCGIDGDDAADVLALSRIGVAVVVVPGFAAVARDRTALVRLVAIGHIDALRRIRNALVEVERDRMRRVEVPARKRVVRRRRRVQRASDELLVVQTEGQRLVRGYQIAVAIHFVLREDNILTGQTDTAGDIDDDTEAHRRPLGVDDRRCRRHACRGEIDREQILGIVIPTVEVIARRSVGRNIFVRGGTGCVLVGCQRLPIIDRFGTNDLVVGVVLQRKLFAPHKDARRTVNDRIILQCKRCGCADRVAVIRRCVAVTDDRIAAPVAHVDRRTRNRSRINNGSPISFKIL